MPVGLAERLEQLLRQELSVRGDRISADSRLVDDLGLDSVGFALGLVVIEERFGVSLTEDQLFACDTFGDLVDIVAAAPHAGTAAQG